MLITITLFIACASLPKVNAPTIEKPPTYELAGLYLTIDSNQMSGVPIDKAKLAEGEIVVIYARGQSPDGKWFELPNDIVITWKVDSELEVTPAEGHVVTVKVVKSISSIAYVTATTTTKDGKKIEALFTITGK